MALSEVLQRLEDELFYAIIDVALDLQREVDVDSEAMRIPFRRMLVRYNLLCPANTPGMIARYCELRWKACGFLQKHSIIQGYGSKGNDHWKGVIEIGGVNEVKLSELVVELRSEESHRNLRASLDADFSTAISRVTQLAETFHCAAISLRTRHAQRTPFVMDDEYDVQDFFAALLLTKFKDVRREEWGPSYAGGATRADFLLKEESIVVETKMTRSGLNDRKIGEELIIDIAHYKQRKYRALLCFVYDPEHRLKNPHALENDLSAPTDGMDVRVLVRPRR